MRIALALCAAVLAACSPAPVTPPPRTVAITPATQAQFTAIVMTQATVDAIGTQTIRTLERMATFGPVVPATPTPGR